MEILLIAATGWLQNGTGPSLVHTSGVDGLCCSGRGGGVEVASTSPGFVIGKNNIKSFVGRSRVTIRTPWAVVHSRMGSM